MKVYEPTERSFLNNGLGFLHPLKCIETKKKSLNGWFVDVEVPMIDSYMIRQDNIVFVETKEKGGQPFRILNPRKKGKRICFKANHIVFDAERYMLDDVRPTKLSCPAFLEYINDRSDTESPFFMLSNINTVATHYFIRKNLLEALEETESLFNGCFDVNGFDISLLDRVGNDNGYRMVYGKNIESTEVNEDWSSVCTKLLPVGPDGLLLPERYVYSDVRYEIPFTRTKEFSIETKKEDGSEKTTDELITELRAVSIAYIEENKYPKMNYTIKSDIEQSLCIGDTIHILHPYTTVDSEVQSYTYDVIAKRVKTLEFGNYSRDVKQTFDGIKDQIQDTTQKVSEAESMIKHQTDLINNKNKLGYVYIDENEILVLDKKPKEEAKNVLRIGLGGIGFSKNGYLGPFDYAFTQDGKLNASMILTGILKAISIEGVNILSSIIDGSIFRTTGSKSRTEIKDGKTWLFNEEVEVGSIGTNEWSDAPSIKGITFDLEPKGGYMAWANRPTEAAKGYNVKLLYTSKSFDKYSSDTLNSEVPFHFFSNIFMHAPLITEGWSIYFNPNNTIRTTWFNDGSGAIAVDGDEFRIVYKNGQNYVSLMRYGSDGINVHSNLNMNNWSILNQSDERLKKNIKDANINALGIINDIELKQYDWIEDGKHVDIGIIAQQLQEIRPSLVHEDDGKLNIKTLDIIYYLIGAVQQLSDELNKERKLRNAYVPKYSYEEKKKFCKENSKKNKVKEGKQ